MLEPSNPRPSSKTSSSSLPTGIVKCCAVPKRSVNRRSTALTSFSRHRARTSRGVMSRSQKSEARSQKKPARTKEREAICAPRSPYLKPHTNSSLTYSQVPLGRRDLLDKQHLLIRRQRPEVVGAETSEVVAELAELGHRRQDMVVTVSRLVDPAAPVVRKRLLQRRRTVL